MTMWPNTKSYIVTSLILWAAFLSAIVAVPVGQKLGWQPWLLIWLAAVPSLTVLVQTTLVYRELKRSDEFVRGLIVKRMVLAIGVTLILACLWSPLEQYMVAPHLPLWLIYPLFWGMFGVVSTFLKESTR